jgi:hypothetical protein
LKTWARRPAEQLLLVVREDSYLHSIVFRKACFEQSTVTPLFPHGVGHIVGLGTRDVGGVLRGRDTPEPGVPPLRMDLPLQPGYAMTVQRRRLLRACNRGRSDR